MGKDHAELAALAGRAVELDVATEGLDGALDDRQTEAGAAGGAFTGAVNALRPSSARQVRRVPGTDAPD